MPVEATKVAAPVDKVLLRSPYKTEATALPANESRRQDGAHVATFDLEAIRPCGGAVNVVVITGDGERICRIDDRDRQKVAAR